MIKMNKYKQILNDLLNEVYDKIESTSHDYYNSSTYDWSSGYKKGCWDTYKSIKNKINKLEE